MRSPIGAGKEPTRAGCVALQRDLAVPSAEGGNTGVVMGGTAPDEAAAVRARYPQLPFLLPGIGRQGGDLEASVRASFTGDPASCLIAIVGAIMYADDPRETAIAWRDRIRWAVKLTVSPEWRCRSTGP